MASLRILNRLVFRGLITITILLMFFNEVLIYYIYQLSWKQIQCFYDNCTRILFVADPQLLGKTYDKSLYSPFARYDSDRYLQKTFERSIAFTQPHILCFLGDLLDEGNVASSYQYRSYVERFQDVFHTADGSIRRIHVPGDNDIGGENGEYISNSNVRRFEIEFMHEDLFDYDSRIRFFKINRMLMDFTNPDRENNIDRIRIGISHMPILIAGGPLLRGVLSDIDPHVIFSAHWHESRIFMYPSSKAIDFYENRVRTYDLNALKNDHNYIEIMVPTSSYRMGKSQMGFGYAVLENNVLHYTVLWNPSRFTFLIIYVLWLTLSLIIFVVFKLLTRCPMRIAKRQQQYNRISPLPQF